jgi:hypothetical protein
MRLDTVSRLYEATTVQLHRAREEDARRIRQKNEQSWN